MDSGFFATYKCLIVLVPFLLVSVISASPWLTPVTSPDSLTLISLLSNLNSVGAALSGRHPIDS